MHGDAFEKTDELADAKHERTSDMMGDPRL